MLQRYVSLLFFFFFVVSGCATATSGGKKYVSKNNVPLLEKEAQPPWTPVYENLSKHVYRYYMPGNISLLSKR